MGHEATGPIPKRSYEIRVRYSHANLTRTAGLQHVGRAEAALDVLLEAAGGHALDLVVGGTRRLVEDAGQLAPEDAPQQGQRLRRNGHPPPAGAAQHATLEQLEG